MHYSIIVLLLFGSGLASPAIADDYSSARAELIAAYEAEDFVAMQAAAELALLARPRYPGALFNLALAKTLGGDRAGALDIFASLVASGVDYNVADLEEFASLQQQESWPVYAAAVAELQEPLGVVTVAYTHERGDFVPEGIVLVGGELLLGSIRHGEIARIGKRTELLSSGTKSGHWSVFGMRAGPDNAIWFTSAAVAQYSAVDASMLGTTGLFRLDLASRAVTEKAVLPADSEGRVLGDLVFADDDTIYLSESLRGELYRYRLSSGRLDQVIAPGPLRSLQGLVLDTSGDYLFVADYIGGLFRVRLSDFSIERLGSSASTNLYGIDGLYRYGDELIAIQNGNHPHRVVAFKLAADGSAVIGSRVLARNFPEFDEPTLGTIAGDDFLFVANSHWNQFDADNRLPDGLSGPIILKLSLRQP